MQGEKIEQLFRDHAAEVLAYALRRTDQATAEDLVSEVFGVAWRRWDRIPDEEPVLWLYGVARRLLANERRAARRRTALTDALAGLARHGRAEGPDVGAGVLDALGRLPRKDREILLLTAWEDLDLRQAGSVLGCSAGAAGTRLHRARARLQGELERDREAARATGIVEVRSS